MSGIDITQAPVSTITIPAHKASHQDAGTDEISLAGLSGEPADVVNKTLFDANTVLKADSDNTPAALTVAEQRLVGRITAGVIAALTATQVRTLLNVADGADVTGSNAPQAHKASHENAGADEVSVVGLSGLLADDQHVLDAEVLAVAAAVTHAASHQNAGADEISVAGLSGELADNQPAKAHAAGHASGGADALGALGIATAQLAANAVTQALQTVLTTQFSTTSTSWVEVTDLSVTITTSGGAVLIFAPVCVYTGSYWLTVTLYRDETDLSGQAGGFGAAYNSAGILNGVLPIGYLDTPEAGTYVYQVYIKVSSGTGYVLGYAEKCTIIAVELKK